MAELLRDNIELERWRSQGESGSSSKSPRWEVPDIPSWCTYFSTYISVVASTAELHEAVSCPSDAAGERGETLWRRQVESLQLDFLPTGSKQSGTGFVTDKELAVCDNHLQNHISG